MGNFIARLMANFGPRETRVCMVCTTLLSSFDSDFFLFLDSFKSVGYFFERPTLIFSVCVLIAGRLRCCRQDNGLVQAEVG